MVWYLNVPFWTWQKDRQKDRQKDCQKDAVNAPISSNSSLSVVDNANFQQMIAYCNPKAQLISRQTLEHNIQKLYESLFQQVHTRLESHCKEGGRVSITLDAWSSETRVPFLGITGHYILATSVPSDQVFSVAEQILTKRRSSLSEGRMNALMCCKNWLGFHEITKEELGKEQDLLAQIQELSIDGDVATETVL